MKILFQEIDAVAFRFCDESFRRDVDIVVRRLPQNHYFRETRGCEYSVDYCPAGINKYGKYAMEWITEEAFQELLGKHFVELL